MITDSQKSRSLDPMIVERRFRGPPDSGNGGYVAGRLAALLAPHSAQVRLHLPPPLEVPLQVSDASASGASWQEAEHRLELRTRTGVLIASARAVANVSLEVPPALTLGEAKLAAQRCGAFPVAAFRGCFVCGPDRAVGDGLRLLAGPRRLDGPDRSHGVAAPWTPDLTLLRDGRVGSEFIWAALDCPGYFACRSDGAAMVLGQMTATIHALPDAGSSCIVSGWPISQDGRKFQAGTALHSANGRLLALAHSIWIELKGDLD